MQTNQKERETGVLTLPDLIEGLVRREHFGVLCTQGDGQPYGSVIAFAFSGNLKQAVFATPTSTRKYRLLEGCPRVALVIDSRAEYPEEMHRIQAITVTGRAEELSPGEEYEKWSRLLVQRHPQLRSFVSSKTTALFRIDVIRYLHVTRFQEVRQWVPPRDT